MAAKSRQSQPALHYVVAAGADGRMPSTTTGSADRVMTTLQEIEKAIEALPFAEQMRLYHDLPQLMGRTAEDLDWQQTEATAFFKDDSPEDAAYGCL